MLQNSYEQNLLDALAEADVVHRWRQPERPSNDLMIDDTSAHALELVKSELIQVGVIVSIVTSLANALESGIFPHIKPQSLSSFAPTYSATFLATVDDCALNPHYTDVAQVWQLLRAHLALARSLYQNFIAGFAQPDESAICPIEIVADSWRRSCAATLQLHALLTAKMPVDRYRCLGEEQTLLLLQSSARGGWPCLARDGRISIPNWAERRSEERRTINIKATATAGSTKISVILENATTLGLGFLCSTSFKPLTELTIELPDGRAVAAYVRWARSGKVGVRLMEPLTMDDPLLAPNLDCVHQNH